MRELIDAPQSNLVGNSKAARQPASEIWREAGAGRGGAARGVIEKEINCSDVNDLTGADAMRLF